MLFNERNLMSLEGYIDSLMRLVWDSALSSHSSKTVYYFSLGKLCSRLGPLEVEHLSSSRLSFLIDIEIKSLTEEDRAVISILEKNNKKLLAELKGELTKRVRQVLVISERDWLNTVSLRSKDGSLRKSLWNSLRIQSVKHFLEEVKGVFDSFLNLVSSYLGTEFWSILQRGQIQGYGYSEEIGKLPKPGACVHCLKLHLNSDGSVKFYKVREVLSNSNVSKKPSEWSFTIGSVHPHCRCVLFSRKDIPLYDEESMALLRRKSVEAEIELRKKQLERARTRLSKLLNK